MVNYQFNLFFKIKGKKLLPKTPPLAVTGKDLCTRVYENHSTFHGKITTLLFAYSLFVSTNRIKKNKNTMRKNCVYMRVSY